MRGLAADLISYLWAQTLYTVQQAVAMSAPTSVSTNPTTSFSPHVTDSVRQPASEPNWSAGQTATAPQIAMPSPPPSQAVGWGPMP